MPHMPQKGYIKKEDSCFLAVARNTNLLMPDYILPPTIQSPANVKLKI